MARYVIEPRIAIALAESRAALRPRHTLLAPTLMRSQVLAILFAQVARGELTRKEASTRMDFIRDLPLRLLGDRVLQRTAWDVALELGWTDTFVAEYIALTQLQADALVTDDAGLAAQARKLVAVVGLAELLA